MHLHRLMFSTDFSDKFENISKQYKGFQNVLINLKNFIEPKYLTIVMASGSKIERLEDGYSTLLVKFPG